MDPTSNTPTRKGELMLNVLAPTRIPIAGFAAALMLGVSVPCAAQLTRPPTRSPTVMKYGAPPLNVQVWGTPVATNVSWSPPITQVGPGLVYSVQRWLESDPDCCKNQVTGLTTTSWFDEGLLWSGAYVYRITAAYSDGSIGLVDTRYVRPEPVNPSNFRAWQVSTGFVAFKWDPVSGATWYQLTGPGLLMPGSTFAITGMTSTTVKNLPVATHSWRLCSMYASPLSPAAVSTPISQCPEATVIVRY